MTHQPRTFVLDASGHVRPVVDSGAYPGPAVSLAERQARYFEVRGHMPSSAAVVTLDRFNVQARVVRGEVAELRNAVLDYVDDLNAAQHEPDPAAAAADALREVRHEIADVVIAVARLASMLPGDVTVEACIEEKIDADRGRG